MEFPRSPTGILFARGKGGPMSGGYSNNLSFNEREEASMVPDCQQSPTKKRRIISKRLEKPYRSTFDAQLRKQPTLESIRKSLFLHLFTQTMKNMLVYFKEFFMG